MSVGEEAPDGRAARLDTWRDRWSLTVVPSWTYQMPVMDRGRRATRRHDRARPRHPRVVILHDRSTLEPKYVPYGGMRAGPAVRFHA